MEKNQGIVFFGTPEFAVPSLEILVREGKNVLAVVTAPDKPSGRGLKIQYSPVKESALKNNIPVLQPANLKDPVFLEELRALKASLFIVVAFRMLPQSVWGMPSLGTFNLHASLLPQYRGAAPINWAIINGETETGLTTFFLKQEIDTGDILFQKKIAIGDNETAGELHDRMMVEGSNLVLETTDAILAGKVKPVSQSQSGANTELKSAPKLNKELTRLDLHKSFREIINHIRGLSPYPATLAELWHPASGVSFTIKIFEVQGGELQHPHPAGTIESDNKARLRVYLVKGYIDILRLQLAGRNAVSARDFLNGFKLEGDWFLK